MKKLISLAVLVFTLIPMIFQAQSLKAYYTNAGDNFDALEMDQEKLFGRYADIIVDIRSKGRVVFSRKTSYLPVWEAAGKSWKFKELVERNGDGGDDRPDILSKYSHVRIISADRNKAVVHWRYFPDFENVEWDGVVDEYFTITSDGKITRETRTGTEKIDDWNNNTTYTKTSYQVSNIGIMEFIRTSPPYTGLTAAPDPEMGPIEELDDPVLLSFSFNRVDLLKSNRVLEEVSRQKYKVAGHKTLIKQGIDGTALHFDGYYSGISIPFSFEEDLEGFTIEAWVALGAYPFGPAPVVQQSIWEKSGFYLGINEDGIPAINVVAGENLANAASDEKLELFRWYHLLVTVDLSNRLLNLYVNGEKASSADIGNADLVFAENDLMIGLNSQLLPDIEGRIRRGKWPSMYGIDGLIDEVRIHSRALKPEDVKSAFNFYSISQEQINNPDMQARNMPVNPAGKSGGRFGAKYTTLEYYETWDNLWRLGDHADVVVSFDDMPVNIVSWRGTSYGPYFVTENGKWIGDQSNEDYRLIEHPGEAEGCLEHMSDKQCRHSHIRIIENSDARVVLHWRYGLVDSRYFFAPRNEGWGGWTDEYWTIYPDGVAVRDVRRGIVFGDGWVETMFLSAPGTMPEDNTELDAFTFINEDGEQTLSWADGMPSGTFDDIQLTMVNSKAEYKMFNVYPTGSSIEVFGGTARRSKFHWWNHWPVSQITSDGRGARAADRMAHSSLVWGAPTKHMLMYGITNKPLVELTVLERSWNSPPKVVDQSNNEVIYDQGQRAYVVNGVNGNLTLTIEASEDSPLYNSCFIVSNWVNDKKAKVRVNGKELREGSEFRQGTAYDTDGELKKILWLEIVEVKPAKIEILR